MRNLNHPITGDTDGGGGHDVIYSHGARSLTIWDTEGKPVFDSGSQIAHLLAQRSPETFNSQGSAGSFDNRSDEKGAEPQAIVSLNGRLYAFLGLERAGGVVIYDVTNPNGATDSGIALDVAPEGIEFVPAQDSPTGMPLLLVANEGSGTTPFTPLPPARKPFQTPNRPSKKNAPGTIPGASAWSCRRGRCG